MKWTGEHDLMLGREILLFELRKYKAGSRERGQCLDRIAESLNQLKRPFFSVTQKSVRDRLKILERDYKKKERFEKNASGISAEKTEMDEIMESYLEQRDDQEKESEKASEESRDKAAKDKASAEDARNKAMERLSETRKRAGSDIPRKKRKSANETLEYLREASDKECELKKQELVLKQKQEESTATQQSLMLQQMKNQQEQFQAMFQMFMQQQQTQSQALLELLKKAN